MKGSAQLEQLPLDETLPGLQPEPVPVRQAAAERLAAHRERRARLKPQGGVPADAETPARGLSRKDQIAAAVAERYAQTPSYRAFLAEEAQRAAQQAAAAAEIAARNAQAAHAVQQELLAELELWDAPQEFSGETAAVLTASEPVTALEPTPQTAANSSSRSATRQRAPRVAEALPVTASPVTQVSAAGLTVRLYEDAGLIDSAVLQRAGVPAASQVHPSLSEDEARALEELDEEIAFRQAPVFDEFSIEPPTPLPANLLEFPRQLVAAKKARPRLAEGPLREDAPRSPQLRIFEVEPEQISTAPAPIPAAPEWTTMRLDAHPAADPANVPVASYAAAPGSVAPAVTPLPNMPRIEAAPVSLRMMAALVDLGLVSFALLGCTAACAKLMAWIPTGVEAIAAMAVTLLLLYGGYALLFFTLSDQTPGMRYARIGLCTFDDENPTRAAMRKRLLAQVLAALPLGIGLLWALLDDESLGWHDRMSKMYQRAY